MSKRVVLDADPEEVATKYRAGAGIYDLSLEYGCSEPTMRNFLVAAGVEIRKAGGIPGCGKVSHRFVHGMRR